jgi:peptidoglycan/LPS O-acetylase OafA/YrhL/peroxiredoxin
LAGPPTVGKPRKAARYSELDALRGAAALGIVGLHAYQNSRGLNGQYAYENDWVPQHLLANLDFGLGMFFALSGFVIFLPFARAIVEGREHIGVKEFALRRAFRILPLYYIAIFAVWDSRWYNGPGQIADLLRHLTFTQVYSNSRIFYTIGPAWSLAVEVHYYVLTGVLVWVLTKIARRVRARRVRIVLVAAPAVLLVLASIAFKCWAYYIRHYSLDNATAAKHYTIYYSALSRADQYAFGMLLAVFVVVAAGWRPKTATLPRMLTVLGVLSFALMVPFRADHATDSAFVELFYYTFTGLGATMLMAAIVLSDPNWRTMRVLRSRPLQLLGIVSFSLYLWHEPIMLSLEKHGVLVFKGQPSIWPLTCVALMIVAVACAWVSYRLIEVPGERLRKLLRVRRQPAPAAIERASGLTLAAGTRVSALPALRGEDGRAVDLRKLAGGRPLIAFVQPRQIGGRREAGCITEARAFRDSQFVFDALGVAVVGVSGQPPAAQKAFRDREGLTFPMLSDPGCSFAHAAGLPLWRDDAGGLFSERMALMIDRGGAIRDVIGADVRPLARAGVAAARSEALLA